jgi:hypothetical protein
LQKQEQEGLPYLFAIVGVPALSGDAVAAELPSDPAEAVALVQQSKRATGKRDFEDAVVANIVKARGHAFRCTYEPIVRAQWYMLSARKADKLLRTLLFDRVYALRIRGFAQQFRAAELDMHFSLASDLVPLREFLALLREGGLAKVTTLMERGEL